MSLEGDLTALSHRKPAVYATAMDKEFEEDLYRDAFRRAVEYRRGLRQRRVAPDSLSVAGLKELVEPLPKSGMGAENVIAELDRIVGSATTAMAGPRFFGFVVGGSYPVSVAATWLAAAWDQATGIYRVTPATATLENVAIDWMLDLFDLPRDAAGGLVTGATAANFTALAAARQVVLRSAGWDVEADGLFGAPAIKVIVGEEFHPSVMKSLGMLGLGRRRVMTVPVDSQGRMIASAMPAITGPTIICTQAGNVNTGSFDPLDEIVDRARTQSANHQVWIHVDGAFGLWAAASPDYQHLVRGIEQADSWATDAHKWLNVPYDCGVTFVRDRAAIQAAMAVTAEYLPMETPNRNPSDFTPELSRRARGIEVWAVLKHLGRDGVAELVNRCCRHARMFADGLRQAGFEILNDVMLNQVLVSFGPPEVTQRVIDELQRDGTCWCGGTVWQGKTAMRISTSNWSTTDDDVMHSLETMVRIARQVSQPVPNDSPTGC